MSSEFGELDGRQNSTPKERRQVECQVILKSSSNPIESLIFLDRLGSMTLDSFHFEQSLHSVLFCSEDPRTTHGDLYFGRGLPRREQSMFLDSDYGMRWCKKRVLSSPAC